MPTQSILEFSDNSLVPILFGEHNSHLAYLEKKLNVEITDRGGQLIFTGKPQDVQKARQILGTLWHKVENKENVGTADIDAALRFLDHPQSDKDNAKDGKSVDGRTVIKTKKKSISPRSPRQATYVQSIYNNDMVFGIGPAGTGKTYLGVAAGVQMFLEGKVERMVFCRPAVEAGENLGFLPGDMKEKVDPYLRPIYDALADMLHHDFLEKKMVTGEIEIAPLAFMRGRTFSNAFVLLDEAQNATTMQMKMFLTRLGEKSRMVITGDLSQSDLPRGVKSGLQDARDTLENVDGISFSYMTKEDVIRHHLVGRIIDAYERRDHIKS